MAFNLFGRVGLVGRYIGKFLYAVGQLYIPTRKTKYNKVCSGSLITLRYSKYFYFSKQMAILLSGPTLHYNKKRTVYSEKEEREETFNFMYHFTYYII